MPDPTDVERESEVDAMLEPEGWEPPPFLTAEQVLRLAAGESGAQVAPMSARTPERDVDTLARVLMAAWEAAEGKPVSASYVATHADMARAVLASDWLAAREAKARAEGGRRALLDAADQLDRDGMKRLGAHTVKQWLRARAREVT